MTSPDVQKMSESEFLEGGKERAKKMPSFADKLSDDDIKTAIANTRQMSSEEI